MPLLKVPVTQSLQIPAIPAGSSESCCVWNGHAQRRLYSEASVLGITIYSCSSGSQLPPGETAGDLVVVARLGIVTRRELSGFACSYMCGPGGSAHGGMVRQVHDWWVIENAHAVQAASASLVSCSVYPWPAIQLAVTSAHGSTSVSPFHFPTGQLSHFGPLSVSAKPSPGGQSVMKLHDRERTHGHGPVKHPDSNELNGIASHQWCTSCGKSSLTCRIKFFADSSTRMLGLSRLIIFSFASSCGRYNLSIIRLPSLAAVSKRRENDGCGTVLAIDETVILLTPPLHPY